MRTSLGLDSLEQELQEALNHLYDPGLQLSEGLRTVLPSSASGTASDELIRAIHALAPASDVPAAARSRRLYEVLECRYIQQLTQEETSEQLGITARHLRREQGQAIHTLAQKLWDDYRARESTLEVDSGKEAESPEWISQVRQELNVLERGTTTNIADVGEAIAHVLELIKVVAHKHDVQLKPPEIQSGLLTSVHPTSLRQVLVRSISELVRHMTGGQIELAAEKIDNAVAITMTARPLDLVPTIEDDLVRELLSVHGGSIKASQHDDAVSLHVILPSAASYQVLVVDDNPDLIHFYQRYVQGTRYQIIPLREMAHAFETIQSVSPDLVVLDVMLPDGDGWELLSHLHHHPATSSIPVIVCSVVREEELALALGATAYIPKPVRRQEFIQALDRALIPAGAKAPPKPGKNAATG